MKDISIARYVFLIDGITDNYKEKKDDQTNKNDVCQQ
jgi:hypothetical protein